MRSKISAQEVILAAESWAAATRPNPLLEVLQAHFGYPVDLAELTRRDFRAILDDLRDCTEAEHTSVQACLFTLLGVDFSCATDVGDAYVAFLRYARVVVDTNHFSRNFPGELRQWHERVLRETNEMLSPGLTRLLIRAVAQCLDRWTINLLIDRTHPGAAQILFHGVFQFCVPVQTAQVRLTPGLLTALLTGFVAKSIAEVNPGRRMSPGLRDFQWSLYQARRYLASRGITFSKQGSILCRVLFGLLQAGDVRLLRDLICAFLNVPIDGDVIGALDLDVQASPPGFQRKQAETTKAEILGYWIRAQTLMAEHHRDLGSTCDWLTKYWQSGRRFQSASEFAFDQEFIAYGQQLWSLHAIVQLFCAARDKSRPPLARELRIFRDLEGLSSRMALLRFVSPGHAVTRSFRSIGNQDAIYLQLTEDVDLELIDRVLPASSAVLGLYDVPDGPPIAILAVKDRRGIVGIYAKAGDSRENLDLESIVKGSERRRRKARELHDAFLKAGHFAKATAALAEGLALAHADMLAIAATRFDHLIDDVLRQTSIDTQQYDLMLIPRGICCHCSIQLLGGESTLLERFRSISFIPSLRVFDHIAGACRPDANREQPLDRPAAFLSYFSHEHECQLVNSLRQDLAAAVCFDFELHQVGLADAAIAFRNSCTVVVLAHGQFCGAKLQDGYFPADVCHLPASSTAPRRRTILFCSCLAGGWSFAEDAALGGPHDNSLWAAQHAFSPIVEAASMNFLLNDNQDLNATCVAGFTEPVQSGVALKIVGRIVSELDVKSSQPFELARLLRQHMREGVKETGGPAVLRSAARVKIVAREHPGELLYADQILNYRIIGIQ